MRKNRCWKKSDSIFLSPCLLHSFPSENCEQKKEAFDGQMFYFSFIIIDGRWRVVVLLLCSNGCIVCISKCLFSLFPNLNTESADRTGGFPSIGKLQITSHYSLLRRGKTENLLPLKALPGSKALLWLMAIHRLAVQI